MYWISIWKENKDYYMKRLINFEIQRIYAGWFDVQFKTDNEEIVVTASDAWGNDSPKLFLQILYEMLDEDVYNKYVVWDEEPGVYMIFISKTEENYSIKIAFSEFCHDELFSDIRNVVGDISFDEMRSKLNDLELLFEYNDVEFIFFLRTVIRAFEEYENSSEYLGNWMDFPHNELRAIKQQLKIFYRKMSNFVVPYLTHS